jgi:hypothetical protein
MGFSSGLKGSLGRLWSVMLLALVLSVGATSARADPTFGFSGGSGKVGDQVFLTISGNVNNFFGADLLVGFDSTQLTFVGVSPWPCKDCFNVDLNAQQVQVTITPDNPGEDLGPGTEFDYFDLIFSINEGASGTSDLELLYATTPASSTLYFDGQVDTYDVTGLTASIRVTASNGVPVASTVPLLLTGLGLLAFARRRAT